MPERTIWCDNGRVFVLDQTVLPQERRVEEITTPAQMWDAIRQLRVRGAPAIGIAAAFGVWLGVRDAAATDAAGLVGMVEDTCDYLATARPTAVNLFWALERMRALARGGASLPAPELRRIILAEARAMLEQDNEVCLAIGRHGAALLCDGDRVLTHCNAGGLATAQYGTALAPVYYACEHEGKQIEVFADETRPLLQGARLTAWELMRAKVPVTLICDSMAGSVMRRGWINAVIVGADRVARNGDFANKIGTYGVAVLAHTHAIPFYVAAPLSSIDLGTPDGDAIPIEERPPDEVTQFGGATTAPEGVRVYNPAFDVTPHDYVTAFITEKGIVRPPYTETVPALWAS